MLDLHMKNTIFYIFLVGICSMQITNSYAQTLKWIYKIGGVNADYGNGLAIDEGQNVYDITNFVGNAIISQNFTATSRGQEDILIRKSTSLGHQQWVKQIGSKGQDIGYDVTVDAQNFIYVAGTFRDTLFYDGVSILNGNQTTQSSFILKINSDGDIVWAYKLSSDVAVSVKTVTSGLGQDLLISGSFEGTCTFGADTSRISNGGNDLFLLKLNRVTSDLIFVKTIGSTDHEYATQHVCDSDGNILITGDFRENVDFDPNAGQVFANTKGITDIFLLKLTTVGNFVWVKTYGGTSVDYGQTLTIDNSGNIILSGRFSETVNFGNPDLTLISNGATDIFLLKLNKDGNSIWANRYGDTNIDQGNQVVVNKNGIIYLAGLFRGIVDFDPSSTNSNFSESKGGADVFIALYNQDGSYNKHFVLGGLANEQVNDIVLRDNGELISVGGFGAIVDFDPGPSEVNIISTGGVDGFLFSSFICVNPYLKEFRAIQNEVCYGRNVLIQITEGYLNDATQWSWQRDSCNSITFAAGNFLNIPVTRNTTFFIKGWGGCVLDDHCKTIDIKAFTDSLRYQFINLCQGDTFYVSNNKYTTNGVYVDSLKSKSGCDSVIITEIQVNQKYTAEQSFSICPGDTVKVGTTNYTTSGRFTNRFSSISGCDSVIITYISLLPVLIETIDTTVCQGTLVNIRNVIYNAAGTYLQNTITADGCKNVLNIHINVRQKNFTQQKVICLGDSIIIGKNTYRNSGTYVDTLTSIFTCDSIVTTNLNVLPTSTIQRDFAFCSGDSVKVGTKVYKISGNFVEEFTNMSGCDSTEIIKITVFDIPFRVNQQINLCEGDSVMVGNKVYKEKGNYTDTIASYRGCDSIIHTNVDVFIKNFFAEKEICSRDSVVVGSNVFKLSGQYTVSLKNRVGCDSIVHLNLAVRNNIFSQNSIICQGQSIQVGNNTYISTGIYRDTFISVFGCDSIVITGLTVNLNSISQSSYSICEGEKILVAGKFYSTTGIYRDTLKNNVGCDSIIVSNLQVNDIPTPIFQKLEICEGESIKIGAKTYTQPNTYLDTLRSFTGCDSIITTQLIVFKKNFAIDAEICAGDSLRIENSVFKLAGKYGIILKNYRGCDSVINLTLGVKQHSSSSSSYLICPGDTVKVGTKNYITPGVYTDKITASNGCDSTIISTIQWNHTTTNRSITLCSGDIFTFNGRQYGTTGIYRDTIKKPNRCDSVVVLNIQVNPRYNIDTIFEICKGTSITVGTSTYFNAGKFTEILQTSKGCDSIIKFEIKVINFIPAVFVEKDTLKAFQIATAEYQWYDCIGNERIPFLGAEMPFLPLFKSGKYSLGITFKGCTFFSDCLEYIRSSTDEALLNDIKIFPNPFSNEVQIDLPAKGTLSIKDLQGKLIHTAQLNAGLNKIDTHHLLKGVYIFDCQSINKVKIMKVIKM